MRLKFIVRLKYKQIWPEVWIEPAFEQSGPGLFFYPIVKQNVDSEKLLVIFLKVGGVVIALEWF